MGATSVIPKSSIHTRTAIAAAAVVGLGLIALPAAVGAESNKTTVHANLRSLNNSGVTGTATVTVSGNKLDKLDASIDATGLLADAPHAAHIHFGETALHECPTQADDGDDDQLTTGEGLPFYGPVVVSFTTSGDTSPASVLAIDRYSTAPGGVIDYDRNAIKTQRAVAQPIAAGEGVVVIHGVDYNDSGAYDFDAGVSDLDSSLPAEATDLAACGVLID